MENITTKLPVAFPVSQKHLTGQITQPNISLTISKNIQSCSIIALAQTSIHKTVNISASARSYLTRSSWRAQQVCVTTDGEVNAVKALIK